MKSSETSNKNINNIIIKKLEDYKISKKIYQKLHNFFNY